MMTNGIPAPTRRRVRMLGDLEDEDNLLKLRGNRPGYDPRKTAAENAGTVGVFDRVEAESEWPVAAAPARMAHELAAKGRGNDTEVAHVARGELVVPQALQSPEVIAALQRAAAAHDIPLKMLSVGNALNRINPTTGAPEFSFELPGTKARRANSVPRLLEQLPEGSIEREIELEPIEIPALPSHFQNQGLPPDVARALRRQADLISASINPNVQAGLYAIQKAEGGAPNVRIGGSTFDDNSRHPGALPRPVDVSGRPIGEKRSAAGSYQMIESTFDEKQKQYRLPDFTEPNQRLAAIARLKDRGALPALREGNLPAALPGASREWAALPMGAGDLDFGRYGKAQPYARIMGWYNDYLNRYDGV